MITTLAKVKTRLAIVDGTYDELLTQLITGMAGRFEKETDRKLERVAGHLEEFPAERLGWALERTPVETITKFELRSDEGEAWEEVSGVDYLLRGKKSVLWLANPLGYAGQVGRVTYTGGYVFPPSVPEAGQTALPEVLEAAAIEQVAQVFQLRSWSGVLRVEATSGTYLEVADKEWVPWVRRVLWRYRRQVIG